MKKTIKKQTSKKIQTISMTSKQNVFEIVLNFNISDIPEKLFSISIFQIVQKNQTKASENRGQIR